MAVHESGADLRRAYRIRLEPRAEYRRRVWLTLVQHFSRWIPNEGCILDLGAGYCEFINNSCGTVRFAMDLNPDIRGKAVPGVTVLCQDSAEAWPIPDERLDVVFTSNFLEHLRDKATMTKVLSHAHRALKHGGRLIALGPNIKYALGQYWDYFDHHIPLTECSLTEVLLNLDFEIEVSLGRFLPYTMSKGRQYPIWILRAYLRLPFLWRFFGRQFLVIARK